MSDLIPIRILLVEDDKDCVNHTKKTLERAGIINDLEVACNGREALRMLDSLQPHVVLLDWVLPDMPGNGILRVIKREFKDTVVIILSIHVPERMEIDGVMPDYYISKPIDPVQFMMVLKSIGGFGFNIVDLGRNSCLQLK